MSGIWLTDVKKCKMIISRNINISDREDSLNREELMSATSMSMYHTLTYTGLYLFTTFYVWEQFIPYRLCIIDFKLPHLVSYNGLLIRVPFVLYSYSYPRALVATIIRCKQTRIWFLGTVPLIRSLSSHELYPVLYRLHSDTNSTPFGRRCNIARTRSTWRHRRHCRSY